MNRLKMLTAGWAAAIACGLLASNACAEIVTRAVEYTDQGTVLEGYLAYDSASPEKRPGVLIVHEWTGLGAYAQSRARQIAEMGYVAFAADIYGKGIRPGTPEEAAKVAGLYKSDRNLMRRRVLAGLDTLKSQETVDPSRLAGIGYCFGGTAVLELARSGAEVRGVVSFHGGLSTDIPAEPDGVKASVLVLHGADDPYVKPEEVTAFEDEMRRARADWQVVSYSQTVHSFTNPDAGNDVSKGVAYNSLSDARSWQAMKTFLWEVFNQIGK